MRLRVKKTIQIPQILCGLSKIIWDSDQKCYFLNAL